MHRLKTLKSIRGHRRLHEAFLKKKKRNSQGFEMKLEMYRYINCDIFHPVQSLICSLQSSFDHFWKPT